MQITFTPQRSDETLTLERQGDTLTVNGLALDFSGVAEGETLARATIASDWIAGDVTRTGGELLVPVLLPHGYDAPEAVRFPDPLTVASDGPVALPGEVTP